VAAWAGNTAIVAWILKSGRDFGSLEVSVFTFFFITLKPRDE